MSVDKERRGNDLPWGGGCVDVVEAVRQTVVECELRAEVEVMGEG